MQVQTKLTEIHFLFQSPEAYFAGTPGLKIVIPRSPSKAKELHLQTFLNNSLE